MLKRSVRPRVRALYFGLLLVHGVGNAFIGTVAIVELSATEALTTVIISIYHFTSKSSFTFFI